MEQITNNVRADFAASALAMYDLKKEGRSHYDAPQDMAADLVCDLMHYIRVQGGDPMQKLEMARTNFEAEEAEQQSTYSPEVA